MDKSTSSSLLFSSVPGTGGNNTSNDSKISSTLIPPDTFEEEESDDDDVLNERVSNEIKIKAMEKAERILSKYKINLNCKTNPNSKTSWLMHTISQIIDTADKVMQPHTYKFENTREAVNWNTKILKRDRYDFTK